MWMLGVDVELIPQCIGSVPLKDRREHNWTAGVTITQLVHLFMVHLFDQIVPFDVLQ